MKSVFLFPWFLALRSKAFAQAQVERLLAELAPHLSSQGLITTETPARWSSFDAPDPAIVVNAETELDVVTAVCNL